MARLPLSPRALAAIATLLALAALPLLFPGDRFLLSLVGRGMIFAIAAVALDLVLGYGALVSFGHAAFLGIGAYAVGILAAHGFDDGLVSLPVAVAAGALFALLTGWVSLRTRGVYFIMITLAFGQMAFFTAQSLSAYGGDDGLTLFSRVSLGGSAILENDVAFYLFTLASLAAVLALLFAVTASRFGRALAATRENERRAAALGFDALKVRLVAYVLSGAIAAYAGALLANHAEFVSPAYMSWQRSGELIVMVVIGGMGTLVGPVAGAIGVVLVEEWLSHLTQHWKAIFGPLVVLVALFWRGGLAGFLSRLRGRR